MGTIFEWHGYRPADSSTAAVQAAAQLECPFVPGPCTKKAQGVVTGVCSVVAGRPTNPAVMVCPKRLYGDGFEFLKHIASQAFVSLQPYAVDATGSPVLVPGRQVRAAAHATSSNHIGVFGAGWGQGSGEIRLPRLGAGVAGSVDFTLVLVSPAGDLLAYAPVEVQTMDTTGSYRNSLAALRSGRTDVSSEFNLNWANVRKRIIPQLIAKGSLLQGERLCTTGLHFVAPKPVYDKILDWLAAPRLRRVPPQNGAITLIPYDYAPQAHATGAVIPLVRQQGLTVTTSDMAQAFITPQNLPPAGAYAQLIEARL